MLARIKVNQPHHVKMQAKSRPKPAKKSFEPVGKRQQKFVQFRGTK
jgi:hypothetical protein